MQFVKPKYLLLFAILLQWGCKPETISKRVLPEVLPEQISDEDLEENQTVVGNLESFSLSPRADSNILSWDMQENVDYSIDISNQTEFGDYQTINNVKSPYTHLKETSDQRFYYRVTANIKQEVITSLVINDEPSAALSTCLAADGTYLDTLRLVFSRSTIQDCYLALALGDQLNSLDLSGALVQDLAPLELFPGLLELDLSATGLTSLQGLEKLVFVQTLNLSDNMNLVSLSGVEPLTRLKSLSLANTGIDSLDPIANASSLVDLDLTNLTGVNSLAPLQAMRDLMTLELEGTAVASGEEQCPRVGVAPVLHQTCSNTDELISYDVHISKLLQIHCLRCHDTDYLVGNPLEGDLAKKQASYASIITDRMPQGGRPLSLGDKMIFKTYLDSFESP